MTKYSDNDIRLMDIARESAVGFWSALLTVNGILVAVFSVTSIGENLFGLFLVFVSIVSAGLIVWNFKDQLAFYRLLGPLQPHEIEAMTEEQKQEELQKAQTQHGNIQTRETVVTALLYLQAILILILLIKKLL